MFFQSTEEIYTLLWQAEEFTKMNLKMIENEAMYNEDYKAINNDLKK